MNITQTPAGLLLAGVEHFDVAQTLDCGQCFRFFRQPDGSWHGVAGRRPLTLRETPEGILFEGVGRAEFDAVWRVYFDIDRDYAAIRRGFLGHPALAEPAGFAPGIRVLRQDAWEALVTFIVSQNNNIPRIRGIIDRLCHTFGTPLGGDFAFPCARTLATLTESALAPLRAGFRAAYILDAAARVADGRLDLDAVATLPLEEARTALRAVRGVGPKVAECVLLYGMGRLDAFPLDVWMKRAMAVLCTGYTPADFGKYAGIAQQYMFHFMRVHAHAAGM